MKPFTELTDQELVALNNEQVNAYIDLACAEQGIPFPPNVPPRPSGANDDAPDLTIYVVGTFNFAKQDDAEKVAALISTLDRWNTKYESIAGEYQTAYVPHFEAEAVTTQRVRSRTALARFITTKAQAIEARKVYQELEMEAARITNLRAAAGCDIFDAVSNANRRVNQRGRYQAHFDRYLNLAGGSVPIACKFFEDAYPDAREILPNAFDNSHIELVVAPTPRNYGGDL